MIKHIVLFKLKDNSPAHCEKVKNLLLSMEGRVPMLRGLAAGTDLLHSVRSYDVAVEALVDDMAALDAYQNDPYHAGTVKAYLADAVESSVCIDMNVEP
jgi:hypothetical protein